MRTASQAFYLAVFALLGSSHATGRDPTRSRNPDPDACAIEPKAIVSDACVSYAALDAINAELSPSLKSITQKTDFFAYYRLNLFNRVCSFWSDDGSMCGNIACAVQTLDAEEDIPEIWRAKELGKLEGRKAGHPGRREQRERRERPLLGELGEGVGESCVVEYDDECDDRDYCVPEDESATSKGDYVSLVDNPERFTGYAGPGARQVWNAIYRENCFSKVLARSSQSASPLSPFGEQASRDLKSVIKKAIRPPLAPLEDQFELDDECLEKRVFYRIISGMHASISTHLCWDYLNQTTGRWGPNLTCYEQRLHSHPEWVSNLYFNYALVLRAVAKLRGNLKHYTFCSGDPAQDQATKGKVLGLVDHIASEPAIFDETQMFKDPSVAGLKDDFRQRFRNVSRLMDCVGCDKCRLWGKLQTAGYGTALKVLFEFDEFAGADSNLQLRRTELVALMNTLARISEALTAIANFRRMIEEQKAQVVGRVGSTTSSHESEDPPLIRPGQRMAAKYSKEQFQDEEEDTGQEEFSFMETFWEEWDRVWATYIFVLKGWVKFPTVAYQIALEEASRAWNFWLGIPVGPRSWQIRWPSRDEL
ncbi:MAG: endoplasmic oxidoreductin-1 [Lichina confinis]|nr:MAG: endoplasmic oxidoreductin-1 [Lichina confinis]